MFLRWPIRDIQRKKILFRSYELIFRTNEILIRNINSYKPTNISYERNNTFSLNVDMLIHASEILIRTNEMLFLYELIFRTNEIVFFLSMSLMGHLWSSVTLVGDFQRSARRRAQHRIAGNFLEFFRSGSLGNVRAWSVIFTGGFFGVDMSRVRFFWGCRPDPINSHIHTHTHTQFVLDHALRHRRRKISLTEQSREFLNLQVSRSAVYICWADCTARCMPLKRRHSHATLAAGNNPASFDHGL